MTVDILYEYTQVQGMASSAKGGNKVRTASPTNIAVFSNAQEQDSDLFYFVLVCFILFCFFPAQKMTLLQCAVHFVDIFLKTRCA